MLVGTTPRYLSYPTQPTLPWVPRWGEWLVVLVFYSPATLFRSLRARSVTCSWASLLGSLPVLGAYSFASNWQLPFFNQRKGENGRRNYFMTNLHERMLPDVRIEPVTVRIPGGRASNQANAPGMGRVVLGRIGTLSRYLHYPILDTFLPLIVPSRNWVHTPLPHPV